MSYPVNYPWTKLRVISFEELKLRLLLRRKAEYKAKLAKTERASHLNLPPLPDEKDRSPRL